MKIVSVISTIIATLILVSFSTQKKPSLKYAMKTLNGFCNYVPSGSAVIDGDTTTVQGFYMSQEITNFQYKEFLYDLKKNGEIEKFNSANFDSTLWNTTFGWENNAYKEYYHSHPAYNDYPAVNITKEGAEMYCAWLSAKYKKVSGNELELKFRIPTRAEWMRAARGDNHGSVYTWGGVNLTNSDGEYLSNHLSLGSQNLTRNPETGLIEIVSRDKILYGVPCFDNADVTAPVESYWPNDFGFYNMNGNVSEMISDGDQAVGGDWYSPGYDIRNESVKDFKGAHPTVGFRVVVTHLTTAGH